MQNPVGVQVKKDIPLRDNLRCSEVTCKVRGIVQLGFHKTSVYSCLIASVLTDWLNRP
jgi:hypothetical protein